MKRRPFSQSKPGQRVTIFSTPRTRPPPRATGRCLLLDAFGEFHEGGFEVDFFFSE
jgi:hypothetical protein